jgi:hypothetical protein
MNGEIFKTEINFKTKGIIATLGILIGKIKGMVHMLIRAMFNLTVISKRCLRHLL